MSALSENMFNFNGGEDKQLKLYKETFQECCNLSKKVFYLFNLFSSTIFF